MSLLAGTVFFGWFQLKPPRCYWVSEAKRKKHTPNLGLDPFRRGTGLDALAVGAVFGALLTGVASKTLRAGILPDPSGFVIGLMKAKVN